MVQPAEESHKVALGAGVREAVPDIERDDELPVGVNLAWRLRALILSGRLPAGDRLPGVRDLAAATSVNVNTIRALYRRLEREGLVVAQHGMGTFVAPNPIVSPALEQVAAEAAEAARELGIEPRELARTIYSGSLPGDADLGEAAPADPDVETPTEESARAARRTLRGQIARLESQLAAYPEEATKAGVAEASPEPFAGPTARIADLGELETVRDQLIDRLKRVRAEVERRGRDEGAARQRLDRMVEDPAAHRWDTVSNQELGKPGCTKYQVQPAWGPVGALMNWWRVKVSAGCPLAGPREAVQTRDVDGQSSRR
ncbi:MAG TPA: GntR family transcriptional regulator [Solirubrobacterales bacterium]